MVEFFSLTTKTTVLLVVVLFGLVDLGVCLNRYVDSYETLNYRPVLDRRKRSLDPDDSGQDSSPLELRFRSHNRTFHLRLHPIDPNTDVFSDDHFLDGYLTNDPASRAYGSVIDGIFDGHIISGDGKYYTVEKAARYFDVGERPSHFHSMIYLDDHINHSKFRLKRDITGATMQDKAEDPRSYCGMSDGVVDNMRRVQESWVDSSSKEFSFKNDHYGDDTTFHSHTGI
uniref:Uncharacterized protein n=1 Tax=Ditylenchus dipsaci TaxID=166011 RepID=A0A915CWT0_9BILA